MDKRESVFYVYILRSIRNGKLYVGQTDNLDRRLSEHKEGRGGRFTRYQGPWKLVYSEPHANRVSAIERERFLKSIEGFHEKKRLSNNGA